MLDTINKLFVSSALESLIVITVTIISLTVISKIINSFVKKLFPDKLELIKKIKKYIIRMIVVITVLYQFKSMHSTLTALLASGSIVAVVIGLASQEAASTTINSMMIIFYKPYVVGDLIYLPEQNIKGEVYSVTLRHTIIETFEKTQVIIPNSIMNKSLIENISNVPNHKANHFFIDISYQSDYNKAVKIIRDLAVKHPNCIDQRTKKQIKDNVEQIAVYCMELKESGISIRATVVTKDNMSGFELLSDLRIQTKNAFINEGIVIPYPHLVVETKKVD